MLSTRLELQFKNEAGTGVTIGLVDPKEDLTAAEIQGVMNSIISENVLMSQRGALISIAGARIVAREITDFEVAPE